MDLLNAILANAMVLICGGMLVLALTAYRLTAASAGLAAGLGYVLGTGLVGLSLWAAARLGIRDTVLAGAACLALVTALAGVLYLRRPRRTPPVGAAPAGVQWAIWGGLLVLLAGNAILLFAEAQSRPVYPWDAWSAWSVKAKVWAHLGQSIDFVSMQQWLQAPPGSVFTNDAWHYPELLPLVELWTVGWVGSWNEQLALLPWSFLYLALLMAAYCGLRLLGVTALAAMIVSFLIGSIPILSVQVALAGYADIWLATELLMFCLCALLFLETGRRGPLLAAVALLVMAAATKLEGLVWGLLCLPVICLPVLSVRARRWTLVALAGIGALWFLVGGLELTLPGGRTMVVTPQLIDVPYLGTYPLAFSNQIDAFVRAFLILPNWHLMGYLLLPCGLWMAIRYRRENAGQGLAIYLSAGLGFLFVLFFMTRAGVWAESMTASNRLALQFVPAAVFWVGLLLTRAAQGPARRDRSA